MFVKIKQKLGANVPEGAPQKLYNV